jgi:hypothetical protein
MTVSIEISPQFEEVLRQAFGPNLSRVALEAMAIEGYRTGKLSSFQVQQMLGLEDRWETEEWMGNHGVNMNYSLEDLEADRRTLDEMLGPSDT